MGGNFTVAGVKGSRIHAKRDLVTISGFLNFLKRNFAKGILAENFAKSLSGSLSLWFCNQTNDMSFGDIDIKVNKDRKDDILKIFNASDASFTCLGYKETPLQIISLWSEFGTGFIFQVDFELVPFEGNDPDEWSMFSKGSDLLDYHTGVKAVFHKYLCRALCALTVQERNVCIEDDVGFRNITETKNNLIFSVDRGFRYRYSQVEDNLWSPRPPFYTRSVSGFFVAVGLGDVPDYTNRLFGFISLAQTIGNTLSYLERDSILHGFERIVFDPKCQRVDNDPSIDQQLKTRARDILASCLHIRI